MENVAFNLIVGGRELRKLEESIVGCGLVFVAADVEFETLVGPSFP
jgi:hypothetical protein